MHCSELSGAQRSEIDLQKISSKLDLQKERLRRLAESLTAEQDLYRKQLNVTSRSKVSNVKFSYLLINNKHNFYVFLLTLYNSIHYDRNLLALGADCSVMSYWMEFYLKWKT